MVDKALFSSKKDDWETPDDLFSKLHEEFNLTLDVCAHEGNAKLGNYFSPEDDGLSQEWTGVCWMNPPYGREISKWVEKAATAYETGAKKVVCLLPVRTDTKWWHDFIWDNSVHRPYWGVELRLLKGRLKFKGAKYSAPFPSCIVIFD